MVPVASIYWTLADPGELNDSVTDAMNAIAVNSPFEPGLTAGFVNMMIWIRRSAERLT
jgi:hypothetical protein